MGVAPLCPASPHVTCSIEQTFQPRHNHGGYYCPYCLYAAHCICVSPCHHPCQFALFIILSSSCHHPCQFILVIIPSSSWHCALTSSRMALQMIARANAHSEHKFSDIPYRLSPWRADYRAGEQACRDFHAIIEGIYQAVRLATLVSST
jgi:hypothetical protein